MDAATILLVLAAAGQAAWTPDRYGSPPPAAAAPAAAAPNYDRYAMPPSSSPSRVAPPPGVVDRARTAVTETGTTLRDGLEAGIDAANRQLSRSDEEAIDQARSAGRELQGWSENASQQFQVGGNRLRVAAEQSFGAPNSTSATNPLAASSAPPAAPKSRGGVAPPPWSGSAATNEPDWSNETMESDTLTNRNASPGAAPARGETGWTSIRSDVAAPRLHIPQLVTASPNEATIRTASNDGRPSFPTSLSPRESSRSAEPAAPANDWATGWGTGAQPATIGRGDVPSTAGNSRRDDTLPPLHPANPRLQDAPQQEPRLADSRPANSPPSQPPTHSWVDLWAENDPLPDSQTPPTRSTNQTPSQTGSIPMAGNAGNPPMAAPAPIGSSDSGGAPVVILPPTNLQPGPNAPGPASTAEQPPWMPLLVVSLSLAGSIGANLFLGFSYLDARQKYRSLIHKTAGKFRRSAAAA